MANWYYYNKNDEKVGPISATALKELARQGLITKETKLENSNGRSAVAGQVNGLVFPTQPVSVTLPPPVPQVSANWHYYDARGQKVGPIPFNVLQSLAANGVITPETSVETGDNVTTIAETIERLTFVAATPPIAPAAPPVTEDVYGFASPLPLAEPDPFASPPANPFANPQPAAGNPFAGVPVASAPAAVSLPTINRGKSQHIPVPPIGKTKKLPMIIIVAGISVACLMLLSIIGVVAGRMMTTSAEQSQTASVVLSAPKLPDIPKLPDLPEKALLRKKIDAVLRDNSGTIKEEFSEEEKDAVAHYLFLEEDIQKVIMREIRGIRDEALISRLSKSSEAHISLLLRKLDQYKRFGRDGQFLFDGASFGVYRTGVYRVDVYIACLAGYQLAYAGSDASDSLRESMTELRKFIETLFPECNTLTGNAYDKDEKARLEKKAQEAEKRELFGR